MDTQANQITIPKFAKLYIKGFLAAYKGRRLISTLLGLAVVGAASALAAAYLLKGFFSEDSGLNQFLCGLAIPFALAAAAEIVLGIARRKGGWFRQLGSGIALCFVGKPGAAARIWQLAATAVGAALAFVNARFMLVLSVCLLCSAFNGEDSGVLTAAAAVENSFNNVFRKNRVRNGENARRSLFALAFGMLAASLILEALR